MRERLFSEMRDDMNGGEEHASGVAGRIHWDSSELMEACCNQSMVRV